MKNSSTSQSAISNPQSVLRLPERQPIIRVKTMPNDANQAGDIFGGWLMSQIDIAGAIVATKRAEGAVATIAVKQLTLLKPLFIYDVVSFYGEVTAVGHTSLTVNVEVFAQRAPLRTEVVKISDATLVYVAITRPGEKREIPK
jgi:acyl-CoA thioesterase YciA